MKLFYVSSAYVSKSDMDPSPVDAVARVVGSCMSTVYIYIPTVHFNLITDNVKGCRVVLGNGSVTCKWLGTY